MLAASSPPYVRVLKQFGAPASSRLGSSCRGKGGHFAAWEEPGLFATEIRAAFKPLR
jgi:hypothetical protein